MKIKTIEISNFKAIDKQSADFNGCSAIITAGNDQGKTTMLKGLIDRFRGEIPQLILREGQESGFSIMELTDGSRIEWKFTAKAESFAYITPDNIKITQGVLRAIGEKYFGLKFDIDKFLLSTPGNQRTTLGNLVGLDFEEINARYKAAYSDRAEKNKELTRISKAVVIQPEKIEAPNIISLDAKLTEIKNQNEFAKEEWNDLNLVEKTKIKIFNDNQKIIKEEGERADEHYASIMALDPVWGDCIDFEKASEILGGFGQPEPDKIFIELKEPEYLSLDEINKDIADANFQLGKMEGYEKDLKEYNDWVKDGLKARKDWEAADKKVKAIEAEKTKMINGAKIPKEFKFTDEGILYNDLPLMTTQLSSSSKYIAALKLGAMALGKLKTMHFDASFLDKKSLEKIQKWANDNDLQLLIERPNFDGGKIKYEII